MIGASIAAAFDTLETAVIPGPWPGASGESWEIEVSCFHTDGFLSVLEKAEIKPRSIFDRLTVEPVAADPEASKALRKRVRSAKTKAQTQKLVLEAGELDKAAAEATKALEAAAEKEREGIVRIGYDVAQYPEDVLSLPEVAVVRADVAKLLVHRVTEISAAGDREDLAAEQVAAIFESAKIIPNVMTLPVAAKGDEPECEVLYLYGIEEGIALAAWVVRHAVQAHRFLERRSPLASASGSPPLDAPTSKPAKGGKRAKAHR